MSCFTFDGLTAPVPADTCLGFPMYTESDAISGCAAEGKHLAIPRNLDELSVMITASGAPMSCLYYWIGCRDDMGGSYHCIDGTPIMSQVQGVFDEFNDFHQPLGLFNFVVGYVASVDTDLNRVAICEYPTGNIESLSYSCFHSFLNVVR